jgi:uncharacterized protein (DUF58 family)
MKSAFFYWCRRDFGRVAKTTLFDDEFLKKLEYLYLVSKKVFAGKTQAQTRSKKTGWGMEFADYRPYNPGDDLRYLDWNLYGRMEQLVTKLFHEEENLNVYFLLDVSESMTLGDPSKFDYARKVVAALAYIALANLDSVSIFPFTDELSESLAKVRGKGQILKIFEFLDNIKPVKATDMEAAIGTFCAKIQSPGMVVVISDFFDEKGYAKPLKTLYFAKHDLSAFCIHNLNESEPQYRGSVQFTDSETGEMQMITISPRILKRYQKEYDNYIKTLQETAHRLQCTFLHAITTLPFDDMILNVFRQGRFIK